MAEKDADARLYAEFLDGDQRALEQLVTLHGDALTRFAYCIVKDDAAAEFDGFSVKEICHVLKKSAKQVYNLLTRARAALKEILIKEGYSHEDI